MTYQLPLIPNLEYLHHQAKGLLKRCVAGDANALAQVRQAVSTLQALPIEVGASSIRLCHAQEATARAYGYARWSDLCISVEAARSTAEALSTAIADPRMNGLDFRTQIARHKGLPEIGSSQISEHGVRYDVVDYMPAVSCVGAARVRAGGPESHINDLLPIIAFPEMSDRLYNLYIETDCVTTRPLIFFDTLPNMHPSMAAPGLNQVLTVAADLPLYFHFDAARLHETIIAHELGHIWVEKVERCEDYRHPKDQSNLPQITQFYHIQSFVTDLCVNDMLMRRGFDMSIIAQHQAETIFNLAANCARGEKPKNRRVLASVINVIAGALLEMERFPTAWGRGVRDALEMISVGLPEAFEPAKGFVRSVIRHGYNDSAAVRRVVDECSVLSFAVTGEAFDPDMDLIEVPDEEPNWDKRPDFLSCLPLSAKLEVCRQAARHGVTGRAKYDIIVSFPHHATVVVSDPGEIMTEPIRLSYNLPTPPPNPHTLPGVPGLQLSAGSAYIPPPGMPYPPNHHPAQYPPSHLAAHSGATGNNLQEKTFFSIHQTGVPIPDPFRGAPEYARNAYQPASSNASPSLSPNGPNTPQGLMSGVTLPGSQNPTGFYNAPMLPDPFVEAKRQNEEQERKRTEERYRQRLLQQEIMQRHCESYSGKDLKPFLTPPGEEYARLRPRRQITAHQPIRNYMAGLGLWISRVGFAHQAAGEHPYGYANNNPVLFADPAGLSPVSGCPTKPAAACFLCMYSVYTDLSNKKYYNYRYCPKKACDLANAACGSHLSCGVCGPVGMVIDLNPYPFIGDNGLLKRIHDGDCGLLLPQYRVSYPGQRNPQTRSADKLAHCIGCCMSVSIGSVLGLNSCNQQYHGGTTGRDPIEDNKANDFGKSCACKIPTVDPDTSWDISLSRCTDCCADSTYNLHCE